MCRKTPVRALCKHLPQNPELSRSLDDEDRSEASESRQIGVLEYISLEEAAAAEKNPKKGDLKEAMKAKPEKKADEPPSPEEKLKGSEEEEEEDEREPGEEGRSTHRRRPS